jgi:metal-responsive CopG/Arc/MetJ family transcriptional regulator
MEGKKIVKPNPKKVGRPATIGAESFVGMRLPTDLLDAVDKWGAANEVQRSEAIRRLLQLGLAADAKRSKRKGGGAI